MSADDKVSERVTKALLFPYTLQENAENGKINFLTFIFGLPKNTYIEKIEQY